MAYLTPYAVQCQMYGCRAKASVELHNRYNEMMGRFCKRHGDKRLTELQDSETKQPFELRRA